MVDRLTVFPVSQEPPLSKGQLQGNVVIRASKWQEIGVLWEVRNEVVRTTEVTSPGIGFLEVTFLPSSLPSSILLNLKGCFVNSWAILRNEILNPLQTKQLISIPLKEAFWF